MVDRSLVLKVAMVSGNAPCLPMRRGFLLMAGDCVQRLFDAETDEWKKNIPHQPPPAYNRDLRKDPSRVWRKMSESVINSQDVVEVFAPPAGEEKIAAPPLVPDAAPLKVLHVLAVSLPHLNGYTIRSKCIVQIQQNLPDCEPVVITSPFYPGNEASIEDEQIHEVRHVRVAHPLDMKTSRGFADLLCISLHTLRKFGKRWWHRIRTVRRRILETSFGIKYNFPLRYLEWRAIKRDFFIILSALLNVLSLKQEGDGGELGRLGRLLKLSAFVVFWPFVFIFSWIVWTLSLALRIPKLISHAIEAVEETLLLRRFERGIVALADEIKPDVIHAHSPYRCGLPAARAAKKLGIPFVYEVRGFWEESSVVAGRFTTNSAKYRFWRRKETQAMKSADAIVCICQQLRKAIAERGIDESRIFVTPNAVDPAEFVPPDEHAAAKAELPEDIREISDRLPGCTLGYVGSLRKLEGVDELVRAAAELIKRGQDVSLLVVGGGPDLPGLIELARELGISDRAVFTDRVPHENVHLYYRLIDVFVISRPDARVTRMVTPLKPLEAMAMERALVMSDLPALREMSVEGETALYYQPGSVKDLADKCQSLIEDAEFRRNLGRNARIWVREHRTWSASLATLPEAYACAKRRAGVVAEGGRP